MNLIKNPGRAVGFLYLLLLVGALRLVYIPSVLFVRGNASATAANIAEHETLFRLGMVTDLFGATVLVFLTLAFYRLFKGVDRKQAILVVILGGVMPACIAFVNVVNDAAALILLRGADFLTVFDQPQREALAMLFLRLHQQELVVSETLWGLWLFPLAILTCKSGFLPRFLALLLAIAGIAYLASSITGLLWPQYVDIVDRITHPAMQGELLFTLWLVIRGVNAEAFAKAQAGRSVLSEA